MKVIILCSSIILLLVAIWISNFKNINTYEDNSNLTQSVNNGDPLEYDNRSELLDNLLTRYENPLYGLSLDYPGKGISITEYKGELYKEFNVVEFRSMDQKDREILMQVIMVDCSDLKSSQNLLEKFIMSEHGVASVLSQNTITRDGFEISQVILNSYASNKEGQKFHDIFSAVKKGEVGWVFVSRYASNSSENLSEYFHKEVSYLNLLDTFNTSSEIVNKSSFHKLKEPSDYIVNETKLTNINYPKTF